MPPKKKIVTLGRNQKKKQNLLFSRKGLCSNGDIRRLARRGGVKRIGNAAYEAAREVIITFLYKIISQSVIYSNYAHRRMVTITDISWAAKQYGRTVLGII